mgnify:CR=1 FL=1
MEFKNHENLNDIKRSQTHNLLLIKHFKPFSLWKGQSNSYLNQKLEVFLAKHLIQNQQLRIGFLTDCLTTAWWLLDHCLMIFWPLSDVCLTTGTGTACWLLTFIMTENCIIATWIRKKIAKCMWKGFKGTNMYKYDTILCTIELWIFLALCWTRKLIGMSNQNIYNLQGILYFSIFNARDPTK